VPLPAAAQTVLARITTLTPGAALVLGGIVLISGAAVWRFVQIGAGLAIGGALGWQLGVALHSTQIGWVAAGAGGIGLAVVCYLVERAAVAGMGATLAVSLADWLWPYVQHTPATWQVEAVASLVGFVIAALLHTRAIQALTALAGAAMIAWAVGFPGNPWLIGGLGAAGVAIQRGALGRVGGGGGAPKKAKKPKKNG